MQFDSIRPYLDSEVNSVLKNFNSHPFMNALLDYAFPSSSQEFYASKLESCHSVQDFQSNVIYPALRRILKETTDGLTTSGFEKLDKNQSYLYISNHRDIVLDTSLTNFALLENDLVMTASAIGDNLVQDDFLLAFAKMNRNFLVERSLSPREMLMFSKKLSEYINHLISQENRSVWLAQREGRTKDGNDQTHQGILKMLSLAKPAEQNLLDYIRNLRIVPLSIAYEYDPTDHLKMPALLASYYDQEYIKTKDEDFNNILTGILGKKKRIHITAGNVLDVELENIAHNAKSNNQQIQAITNYITDHIHQNYKLWPTNFIAHDILYNTDEFSAKYSSEEKSSFEARVKLKTDSNDPIVTKKFLAMYAYPVLNKLGFDVAK